MTTSAGKLAVAYGCDLDDLVNFRPLPSPFTMPSKDAGGSYPRVRSADAPHAFRCRKVWPAGLLGDDVLLFDATRRTLVVDGHGRLAVGATFTEQLEAQRMIETRGIRAMARIDLFLIARMLGHSVARTTELYAHHHPSWLSGAAAALGAVTKSNAKPEKNKGSASDR